MMSVCLLVLLGGFEVEPPEFYAANEELRDYLFEAGERHPELHMLHEEWLAALERIPQAKSLDDPMFGFSYILRSPAGWGRYTATLSQMLPWFGTLRARGDKSAAEADAALARFYAARNRVFADVKKAYFEYAYLAQSIHVVEAQVEILKFTEDIARSRFSLGMSPQEDLLRVQIEQSMLQDRYDEYNQYRPALSARLNETLGRDTVEDLPWPQPTRLPPPPPPPAVVLARVRVANPELGEADSTILSREYDIVLAKKKRFPDFTVGIEYMDMKDVRNMSRPGPFLDAVEATRELANPGRIMLPPPPSSDIAPIQRAASAISGMRELRDQGIERGIAGTMNLNDLVMLENAFDNLKMKDQISVSLEFNVPIYRKRIKSGIQEARHMEFAAEHAKHRRALGLNTEARMALFGIQDGQRRHRLYSEVLVPQAKLTYEAVQAAYASGDISADFLDVLMSIQTLLDFELETARAARDIQIAAAELEMIMGGPWSSEDVQVPDAEQPDQSEELAEGRQVAPRNTEDATTPEPPHDARSTD